MQLCDWIERALRIGERMDAHTFIQMRSRKWLSLVKTNPARTAVRPNAWIDFMNKCMSMGFFNLCMAVRKFTPGHPLKPLYSITVLKVKMNDDNTLISRVHLSQHWKTRSIDLKPWRRITAKCRARPRGAETWVQVKNSQSKQGKDPIPREKKIKAEKGKREKGEERERGRKGEKGERW